ncbi:hypothetical protein JMK10_20970 [Rhodovulum sulfidophilum]|uniref:hypothetical protein n=1 Tax=Rhodovulum sulfidophilum TaxID=35806 RepID=UPI00192400FB|nr:hypothetical protein [Rhodovulum sulfidophilum]MBL3576196.1 hypothetical protein [Rhodovulum sulfidophilum]MCE8433542.1 hypothetical protein [Rhodovulum sulfidophilum]MCF4119146.1 hypothetical protein [Rhodovulum sulfidophilum]
MDKSSSDRFDYSAAKWNRLSRSIKRVDDGTVEIRNPTNSVGKLIINLLILFQVGLFCANAFIRSGELVHPHRPSSFDTLRQMIYQDYLWITDPDAYLESRYQNYLEDWEDPNSIRSSFPLRSKDEYVEGFLSSFGPTAKMRFDDTLRRLGFGPLFIFLVLFLPLRIFMPDSHGIRLDARRRVAYVRDWFGNSIKRFFGMADLRPRKKREEVDVLERLHFTTRLHAEYAVTRRLLKVNKIYKLLYPFRKPAMVYLSEKGHEYGYTQRFPLGSYPMRKNQPEEIQQFIEDFLAHPEPGEWTKNLRYRYPLPGDLIVWLIRANLWKFGGYKKANAEDKVDACLKELDT